MNAGARLPERHQALSHLKPSDIVERGDTTYRISRWHDAAHIFKRVVVNGRGSLAIEDFQFMFSLCGLEIVRTYGDYRPRRSIARRRRA